MLYWERAYDGFDRRTSFPRSREEVLARQTARVAQTLK